MPTVFFYNLLIRITVYQSSIAVSIKFLRTEYIPIILKVNKLFNGCETMLIH